MCGFVSDSEENTTQDPESENPVIYAVVVEM